MISRACGNPDVKTDGLENTYNYFALTVPMNFASFCHLLFKAQYFDRPDLGPNCLLSTWVKVHCLIRFFTSHQQTFSYVERGLPGLNPYLA